MHQAKRNMANCALYATQTATGRWDPLFEPVTNFRSSAATTWTGPYPGALEAGLSQVDEAPHQKSVTEGRAARRHQE